MRCVCVGNSTKRLEIVVPLWTKLLSVPNSLTQIKCRIEWVVPSWLCWTLAWSPTVWCTNIWRTRYHHISISLSVWDPYFNRYNLSVTKVLHKERGQLQFTRNVVCVDVRGPRVSNLTLIDLPGLSLSVSVCLSVYFCRSVLVTLPNTSKTHWRSNA